MSFKKYLALALYTARCMGSAFLAYYLAQSVGLPFPIWASISAVVVSQEKFSETRITIIRRFIGTILGVCVSIAVNVGAQSWPISMPMQMTIAVGISAVLAYGHPAFRASLWTCPIVLLTALPNEPIFQVGFYRGSEVILGGLIAGALHYLANHLPALRGSRTVGGLVDE